MSKPLSIFWSLILNQSRHHPLAYKGRICITKEFQRIMLEGRQWKENEIENASILVDLIQDTKKEEMAYPDGRILILSRFHIDIVYI